MATVGIIAEYNPFHLGHKYQIDKIRELHGSDTAIIAVMSGNITQRGEVAVFDKAERARAALSCGVNLVLELPFPHCASSAQFFAEGAVKILDSLGVVDFLSFGSECGDIETLKRAASALTSAAPAFTENHDSQSYAKKCEDVCNAALCGSNDILKPNNILGIEYIKALHKFGSRIAPLTLKRSGDGYTEKCVTSNIASAMAIRELIYKNDDSAFDYIPQNASCIFKTAIQEGRAPCLTQRLDAAVISSLRLSSSDGTDFDIQDADGGLYNRIQAACFNANTIFSLTELAKTKKYTTARIRRAIWFSYFGVTSSDVRNLPSYTQLLAADGVGTALLKRIKKVSDFPILTKPSAINAFSSQQLSAKALSDKADSVLQLTKPDFVRGDATLLFTPFVKKQ